MGEGGAVGGRQHQNCRQCWRILGGQSQVISLNWQVSQSCLQISRGSRAQVGGVARLERKRSWEKVCRGGLGRRHLLQDNVQVQKRLLQPTTV